MLVYLRTQQGVTLIELMIASVISLIILSAILTVYSITARHSSRQLQAAHLHQQLHGLMHLLASDIRRAGYWGFDPALQNPGDNPFQNTANALRIDAYRDEAAGSCIVLAYDLDQDGNVGVGTCGKKACAPETDDDNVEQFGFRLRAGSVQSRYGGAGMSCDSGYWQSLTDSNIEITHLEFTQHASCSNLLKPEHPCAPGMPQLIQQSVEIRLRGRNRDLPGSELDLGLWVRVRNDQLRNTT